MKVQFGSSSPFHASTPQLSVSSEDTEEKQIRAELDATDAPAAAPPDEPAAITTLTAGNIAQAVGTANDAIESITALREEQRELAALAYANPEVTATHSTYDELIGQISDEIQRISTSATYNGSSVLSGGTYELTDDSRAVNEVITTPSASSLTEAVTYNARSGAEALSTYDSLSSAVTSLRIFSADIGAAQSKAERLPEVSDKPIIETDPEPPPPLTESEARKLAQKVAEQVGSAYGDGDATSELIEAAAGSLSAERVRGLLE